MNILNNYFIKMKKKLNILAIILARSVSKSIKNKNLKKINNIPLIKYSINIAEKSKLINKTREHLDYI